MYFMFIKLFSHVSNIILNIKTSLLLRLRCLCHIVVKKGLFEYQWDVFFSGGSLPEKKMRYFEDSSSTRFKVTKQNSHKKVLRKPFHVFITQDQVP